MNESLPYLDLDAACAALKAGKLLIFPTETFFAVGCDAFDPDAVGAVFSVKKRSLNLPLPLVIATREHLARVARFVPPVAEALMDTYWPGPLSIILPARPEVPDLLTANAGRIAVRFSPHPAVHALCMALDMILVASSANISGSPPVIRPEGLSAELLAGVAGVYQSPPAPLGGAPSTVVDIISRRGKTAVRVLRPGAISEQELRGAGFTLDDAAPQETHS